jgi:hypothetical protein
METEDDEESESGVENRTEKNRIPQDLASGLHGVDHRDRAKALNHISRLGDASSQRVD